MEALIQENLGTYGPIAVFVLLALSAFGLSPGEEMVTIPAGVFVATGELGFWPTAACAYAAVVLGDCTWFALCRHYGMPILHKKLIERLDPRGLLEVKHQFEHRGAGIIVLARFVPGSRTTTLAVAGIMDMPFWQILVATATCAAVTVPLQIGLGVLIGLGIGSGSLSELLPRVGGLVLLIVVASVLIAWSTQHRGHRRAPRAKASWLRRFRVRSGAPARPGR